MLSLDKINDINDLDDVLNSYFDIYSGALPLDTPTIVDHVLLNTSDDTATLKECSDNNNQFYINHFDSSKTVTIDTCGERLEEYRFNQDYTVGTGYYPASSDTRYLKK